MIKKLSLSNKNKIKLEKTKALENVKGGYKSPSSSLTAILCSAHCEDYCGDKEGSDGTMWVGWRDL